MMGHLNLRRHVRATSSWGVIGLLIAAVPGMALAQDAVPESGPEAASGAEDGEILVVGTRASQQSAIDRKKRASTATDSLVADDIGSFPDRNMAEAVRKGDLAVLGTITTARFVLRRQGELDGGQQLPRRGRRSG